MAVTNLNPGVGPTNADIATAVAAPSAATIAAAVAAPSAATIASAVAAPSSATIATAVAAAVPTTAGITTIVQANAGSPYAGTWTYLGYVSGNGTATVSYTGLSSYKYLKVYYNGVGAPANTDMILRINGTSSSYAYFEEISGTNTNNYGTSEYNSTAFYFPTTSSGATANCGTMEFKQSNSSTAPKTIDYQIAYFVTGQGTFYKHGTGIWVNNSAISSMAFTLNSGSNFVVPTSTIGGFYMWGGN